MRLITLTLISCMALVSAAPAKANEGVVGIEGCETKQCQSQFKEFRKLARNGSPRAQLTIAGMYYAGYGVERDVKQALNWFRKAAKFGGVSFGTYRAGMIYLFDKEVEQNIEKGVEFLKRAAEADHPQAAWVLANLYIGGKLVEKDMMEGFKWLQLGAKLGDPESLYRLAKYYEDGITGKKETAAAISLYKVAAKTLPKARERLLELKAVDKNDDIFAGTEDNGMEKITVTAPDLPTMFDTSLESIKATGKFNSPKTCSRLSSSPCGTQVTQVVAADKIQDMFDGAFSSYMSGISAMSNQ